MGDDVTIITHSQTGRPAVYPFSSKIKLVDLHINYEAGVSYFNPLNLMKIARHYKALKSIIKQLKPDIVISSSFGPDYYFIPAACCKVAAIKEYHTTAHFTSQTIGFKVKILRTLADRIDPTYAKRILLNEDEVPYYKGENIGIIPNPTELDARLCSLEPKAIIAAGRISYQKNFEDLLTAFALIENDFPDWVVHVYGEDYLGRQKEIQKQIDSLGLQERFVFKGVTSDLKKTFTDYSIYAMTSIHETFPMVLLEALSVGMPIVSYDCPTGPSRIVTNLEDGFITPYKNSVIFAEKISKLMKNKELRIQMGEKAKLNAERFEISRVMEQWKSLFNSLLN